MCVDREALVSTLKRLLDVSPSFRPISFEASRCENLQGLYFLQVMLALEVEKEECEAVSVGRLRRFTAVAHLTV